MNLSPLAHEERALPAIWVDGLNTERIDWYTELVIDHPLHWGGREVVAEFIAAMLLESGLDNLTLGNNANNVGDTPHIGIGWCQLDTGYHATPLEYVHTLRADPTVSLDYIAATPDLAYIGTERIWLNSSRWHAWEPKRIDPTDGSWSPLKAALESYDRVS